MASNNSSERENNDVPLEFRIVISVDTEEPQEQPNVVIPVPERPEFVPRTVEQAQAELQIVAEQLQAKLQIYCALVAQIKDHPPTDEDLMQAINRSVEDQLQALRESFRTLLAWHEAELRSVWELEGQGETQLRSFRALLEPRAAQLGSMELLLRVITEAIEQLVRTRAIQNQQLVAVRERNQQLDSVRERNPLAEAPRGRVLRQIAQPDDSEEIFIDEEARVYPAKEMGDETSIFKIVPQLCENSSKIQDQCPTVKLIGLREKEGSATSKELSLARNINSFCYNAQSNSSKDSPTNPLVFKVFLTGRDDVNVPSVAVSEKSPLGCIESSWGKGSMSYDGRCFQLAEFVTC